MACPRCCNCMLPDKHVVPEELLKDGRLVGIKSKYLYEEFGAEDPPWRHQIAGVVVRVLSRKNYPKSAKKGPKKGLDVSSMIKNARKGRGQKVKGSGRPRLARQTRKAAA